MANNRITVNTAAFQAGMNSRLQALGLQVRDAARRYAESAVEHAKPHIHTVGGELAGSLRTEDHLDEKPAYIIVGAFETAGSEHPHAVETEFGSSKEAPRPFLRPGLEEARGDFKP